METRREVSPFPALYIFTMILPHRVPYLFLARTFAEISQHSARTKILGFLVNSMIPPVFLEVQRLTLFIFSVPFHYCLVSQ